MAAETGAGMRERGLRRNSLIFRILSLCVLLVLCLFGVVYVLTAHTYREAMLEMQKRAAEIAGDMQIWLDEHPDAAIDWADPPEEIADFDRGVSLRLRPIEEGPREVSPGDLGNEADVFEATHLLERDGRIIELHMRLQLQPQTEILRAFKNRYLVALTIAFLVTLALLVALIYRALRPLRNLADSCAKITKGRLEPIEMKGNTTEIRSLERTFNQMVHSLAEKELVETNLRQAQRLSAIGNLAAGVAHDVRNPLNAIKLLSGHAIDTLEDGAESGTAVKQLRTIRNEVDRLENIVSGFLSLAKEEELRLEPQPIDPLLSECLRLVKKDAEARQVHLHSDLRAGDRPLYIDAQKLTRAIINVLINALEACPPGGRVRLFSRMSEHACEVEIRDDGPGMQQDVLERVFEPYYTTKATGTGLGLAITRGIVQEHGGDVEITSSQAHGTQVLITLPLERPAQAEQVA